MGKKKTENTRNVDKGLSFPFWQCYHNDPGKIIGKNQSSRHIWMAFLNSMYKEEFLGEVQVVALPKERKTQKKKKKEKLICNY